MTLSYEIRCDRTTRQVYAWATCAGCGAKDSRHQAGRHAPEMIAKHFRRNGWEFNINNSRLNICPECIKGRSRPMKATVTIHPPQPAFASPPAIKIGALGVPRDLTKLERLSVRNLLDKFFDDDKGIYLDAYTDERVAIETNTPRAAVALLREHAYGPILVSAAEIAWTKELGTMRQDIDKLYREASQIVAAVQAQIAKVDAALARGPKL